jgi:hypothetical protein
VAAAQALSGAGQFPPPPLHLPTTMGSRRRLMMLIALVSAVSALGGQVAQAKTITGTKFAIVYHGKTTVFCRLDYSLQYSVMGLYCLNRTNVAQFLPGAGGFDLGPDDGSIKFPETAPLAKPGDLLIRVGWVCQVKTYGRLRCFEFTRGHGMVVAGGYINTHPG